MINSKRGTVEAKGLGTEIYADLKTIAYVLRKNGLDERFIETAIAEGIVKAEEDLKSESNPDFIFHPQTDKSIFKKMFGDLFNE